MARELGTVYTERKDPNDEPAHNVTTCRVSAEECFEHMQYQLEGDIPDADGLCHTQTQASYNVRDAGAVRAQVRATAECQACSDSGVFRGYSCLCRAGTTLNEGDYTYCANYPDWRDKFTEVLQDLFTGKESDCVDVHRAANLVQTHSKSTMECAKILIKEQTEPLSKGRRERMHKVWPCFVGDQTLTPARFYPTEFENGKLETGVQCLTCTALSSTTIDPNMKKPIWTCCRCRNSRIIESTTTRLNQFQLEGIEAFVYNSDGDEISKPRDMYDHVYIADQDETDETLTRSGTLQRDDNTRKDMHPSTCIEVHEKGAITR